MVRAKSDSQGKVRWSCKGLIIRAKIRLFVADMIDTFYPMVIDKFNDSSQKILSTTSKSDSLLLYHHYQKVRWFDGPNVLLK